MECFDNLTNSEKPHRKRKEPFGSMKLIQDEIFEEGKFDKSIFKDFCLSLLEKGRFD